ncbi:MAG: nuclear transport factor 2 family protein [Treponema sp.]|nr:nuclear transport factor 2 family protein [Treponema sp.]
MAKTKTEKTDCKGRAFRHVAQGVLLSTCVLFVLSASSCASSARKETSTETVDGVEITNSYTNTEELKKKFPVIYPTPIDTKLGKNIENRLLTGFDNWNRGFDGWKAWGTILYTDSSIYNVHGARLTLAEYQSAMDMTLKQVKILMGDFQNIIIRDDWAALHFRAVYTDTATGVRTPGDIMQFYHFVRDGNSVKADMMWSSGR